MAVDVPTIERCCLACGELAEGCRCDPKDEERLWALRYTLAGPELDAALATYAARNLDEINDRR